MMLASKKNPILHIPAQKTPSFSLPAHTVTWESFPSQISTTLAPADVAEFFALHEQGSQLARKRKQRIAALRKKYPHHPEILNLAALIYLSHYRLRQANRCIELNYQFNPDYLFAKINYADLCLRRKKPAAVPPIFNGHLSLRALYPNRKVFHVSEFRGFMVVMGLYHLSIGERDRAACYHYLAHRVDPHHPSTKVLQKKLYALSWYHKLFQRYR
ncbi:MAG: hypothetical protein AAF443_01620 [Chlamydiota bacterium]